MMRRKILFSAQELRQAQRDPGCITVDCRHQLTKPEAGRENYLASHILGAVYAHLDEDLSSKITGASGRHPLPDPGAFAAFLARAGWSPGKTLVAYDDAGGAIAARLWWLMKYFGHDCAALLDGGIDAWRRAGFDLERGDAAVSREEPVVLVADKDLALSTAALEKALHEHSVVLADARAAERYNGEVEPIDTKAGHVPGAVNYPYSRLLTGDGTFRGIDEIRHSLEEMLGDKQAQTLVHMCGSGVTACLNLFAAELAGLPHGRLYPGSWSEWIRDPRRAIES